MKWLIAVLFTGCATVTPMQTASVVDVGRVRVGGQLSAGPCGQLEDGLLGVLSCNSFPDGVPLPELRVNARAGFARGFDVGLSLQAYAQLLAPERPFQMGLTADVKGELLRLPTSGPTHIVSIGLLGGGAIAGRLGLPLWAHLEWAVPLFYGLQFAHWELVASTALGQRFNGSPNVSPSSNVANVSFSLGLYKRDPAGFAVQLSYLTDPQRFATGAIQLQIGLFFDVALKR
ncbi:MAG: hypothetical protein Q8N23_28820 [Archangium sp.]|nr:hypothetical protein [Archangium sp.]MDP3572278.1 hypothetical protein [Archangium sp.]